MSDKITTGNWIRFGKQKQLAGRVVGTDEHGHLKVKTARYEGHFIVDPKSCVLITKEAGR